VNGTECRLRNQVARIIPEKLVRHWTHKPACLLQLSYAARALPPPAKGKEEALIEFVERRRAQLPNRDWVGRHSAKLPASTLQAPKATTTFPMGYVTAPSSSLTTPRRAGGKAGEWFAKTCPERVAPDSVLTTAKLLAVPPDALNISVRNDISLAKSSAEGFIEQRGVCRLAAIAEPGAKWRIATVHPLREGWESEQLAQVLRAEVRNCPPTRGALEADPEEFILVPDRATNPEYRLPLIGRQFPTLELGEYYDFSSDLKAATDVIHRNVIQQFLSSRNLPEDAASSQFILFRKMLIPIGCGTDLGKGCSFPTLCLLHHYVCRELGLGERSYRIKGDDLVARWTGYQIELYAHWIPILMGPSVNLKKVFVSKDRSLYCESAFQSKTDKDGQRVYKRLSWSMSLKVLHADLFKTDLSTGVTEMSSIGNSLRAGIRREGRKRTYRLFMSNPSARALLARCGSWVFIPSSIGGLGFIRPRRRMKVPAPITLWCRAVMNGGITPPSRSAPVWASDRMGMYSPLNFLDGRKGGTPAYRRSPTTVEEIVRGYVSKHLPRKLIYVDQSAAPINGAWADIADAEVTTARELKYTELQAKALADRRLEAQRLVSYQAVMTSAHHGEQSAASTINYVRLCRRQVVPLSSKRLVQRNFEDLERLIERSFWVPKAPERQLARAPTSTSPAGLPGVPPVARIRKGSF